MYRSAAPSYIGWSIFSTQHCCLLLGIAAVVCFCQDANTVGESATAQDESRTAKILNIIGLVCGIILLFIVSLCHHGLTMIHVNHLIVTDSISLYSH
uniref:Uncharacterized protein n=1 Tax=Sphaeramia orbicularis TaxID=375764 RepID=A0A673A6V9_9TELE